MRKTINKKSCVYVAGHKGLVGSSILRRLKYYGYKNILTATRKTLDLRVCCYPSLVLFLTMTVKYVSLVQLRNSTYFR